MPKALSEASTICRFTADRRVLGQALEQLLGLLHPVEVVGDRSPASLKHLVEVDRARAARRSGREARGAGRGGSAGPGWAAGAPWPGWGAGSAGPGRPARPPARRRTSRPRARGPRRRARPCPRSRRTARETSTPAPSGRAWRSSCLADGVPQHPEIWLASAMAEIRGAHPRGRRPVASTMTLKVGADNWMAALKAGMSKLGEQGSSVQNVMVDIQDDNSIHVTESRSAARLPHSRAVRGRGGQGDAASRPSQHSPPPQPTAPRPATRRARPAGGQAPRTGEPDASKGRAAESGPATAEGAAHAPPRPRRRSPRADARTAPTRRAGPQELAAHRGRQRLQIEELEQPIRPVTAPIGRKKTGAPAAKDATQSGQTGGGRAGRRLHARAGDSEQDSPKRRCYFILDLALEKVPCRRRQRAGRRRRLGRPHLPRRAGPPGARAARARRSPFPPAPASPASARRGRVGGGLRRGEGPALLQPGRPRRSTTRPSRCSAAPMMTHGRTLRLPAADQPQERAALRRARGGHPLVPRAPGGALPQRARLSAAQVLPHSATCLSRAAGRRVAAHAGSATLAAHANVDRRAAPRAGRGVGRVRANPRAGAGGGGARPVDGGGRRGRQQGLQGHRHRLHRHRRQLEREGEQRRHGERRALHRTRGGRHLPRGGDQPRRPHPERQRDGERDRAARSGDCPLAPHRRPRLPADAAVRRHRHPQRRPGRAVVGDGGRAGRQRLAFGPLHRAARRGHLPRGGDGGRRPDQERARHRDGAQRGDAQPQLGHLEPAAGAELHRHGAGRRRRQLDGGGGRAGWQHRRRRQLHRLARGGRLPRGGHQPGRPAGVRRRHGDGDAQPAGGGDGDACQRHGGPGRAAPAGGGGGPRDRHLGQLERARGRHRRHGERGRRLRGAQPPGHLSRGGAERGRRGEVGPGHRDGEPGGGDVEPHLGQPAGGRLAGLQRRRHRHGGPGARVDRLVWRRHGRRERPLRRHRAGRQLHRHRHQHLRPDQERERHGRTSHRWWWRSPRRRRARWTRARASPSPAARPAA